MLRVFETNKFGTDLSGTSSLVTSEPGACEYKTRAFELNSGKIGDFKSYEEFSEFIMKSSLIWSFVIHPPARVKHLCRLKDPEYITLTESIALEKSLGLIEMRRGNNAPLRQVVMTPDVDVEAYRKIWCTEYSQAKRYAVFEISLHKDSVPVNVPQHAFSLISFPFHQSEDPHHA